jgi:hypothetical protein
MKKAFTILTVLIFSKMSYAQNMQSASDIAAVKQTIKTLLNAVHKGDSSLARSVLSKDLVFQSLSAENGKAKLETLNPGDLLQAIGSPHASALDERVVYNAIKIDGDLACVWAPYKFMVGDQFDHCGLDVFQLMRTEDGWKVIYIGDTQRKDHCIP